MGEEREDGSTAVSWGMVEASAVGREVQESEGVKALHDVLRINHNSIIDAYDL
jgi:hypothetical protein